MLSASEFGAAMLVPQSPVPGVSRRAVLPFAAGILAFVCQTLLFRSFFGAFESNEIGIALFLVSWLLWVAAGAVAGRGWLRRVPGQASSYDLWIWLYVPAFLLQLTLCDYARTLAGVPPYALFPLARLLPAALLVNAPVSWITGWLFTLASEWLARTGQAPVSRAYMLDALGCAAGGLGTTVLLAVGFSEERIFLVAVALLGVAGTIAAPPRRRVWPAVVTGVAILLLALNVDARWTRARDRAAWTRRGWGTESHDAFATPRARYRIGRRKGEIVILAGESLVETLPAEERARTAAALHLAQHPRARRVLVIGPGSYALSCALLRAPGVEKVCWLHPDPDYPARLVAHLPPEIRPPSGLEMPGEDARVWARRTGERFDFILLDLPDPAALALNRYLTVEFLGALREHLTPYGVVGVSFGGGENVLGEDRARLGAVWRATLSRLFAHLALRPGEESWWYASDADHVTENGNELRRRWRTMGGAEDFYPADALATWYPPERIQYQKDAYAVMTGRLGEETFVNRDAHPSALASALAHATLESGGTGAAWLARAFRADASALTRGALTAALAAALLRLFRRRFDVVARASELGGASPAHMTVAVGAAASMGFGVALMYLFQARFGAVFLYMGLLSSLSMLGLWAGNAATLRLLRGQEPRWLLPLATAMCAALAGGCALRAEMIGRAGIAVALGLGGFLSGVWVPAAAARLERRGVPAARAASVIAAADALGGAVGGLIVGLWLLPVTGVPVSLALLAALWCVNFAAGPAAIPSEGDAAADRWGGVTRRLGHAELWVLAVALAVKLPWRDDLRVQMVPPDKRLTALAEEWAPGISFTAVRRELSNGMEISALSLGMEGREGWIATSESLGISTEGFGGPVILGFHVASDGSLRALRVLAHNETPAYYARTEVWQRSLIGRNLFDADALATCDTVTGATVTSRAILDTLAQAGVVIQAAQEPFARRPSASMSARRADVAGVALAAAACMVLWIRRRPSRTVRRAILVGVVVAFGVIWNVQFSTAHLQVWLTGRLPAPAFTAAALLAFGVPLLVFFAGNVYCGWLCPFGALQELAGDGLPHRWRLDPDRHAWRRGRALKYAALFVVAMVLVIRPASDPGRWDPLVTVFLAVRDMHPMRWAALGFLALAVVFRRYWCRQWCPAGALLSWIGGGLGLFRRWRPHVWVRGCDLGVVHCADLDCLACDRCRAGKEMQRQGSGRENSIWKRVPYAAAIGLGAVIWGWAIAREPRVLDASDPFTSSSAASTEAGVAEPSTTQDRRNRPAAVERIRELQRRGRLSDEEARYYETVD